MENAQAIDAGLALVFRSWPGDGSAWLWHHFLIRGRAVGLLPSGEAALWLHGALQEKEPRPGAGRQRTRPFVVTVRFQLSVPGVHCRRPECDGPRAAITSERRQHGYAVVAGGDDCGWRMLADSSASAGV